MIEFSNTTNQLRSNIIYKFIALYDFDHCIGKLFKTFNGMFVIIIQHSFFFFQFFLLMTFVHFL